MNPYHESLAFAIKIVILAAAICGVFEFVMWRLFRADFKAPQDNTEAEEKE